MVPETSLVNRWWVRVLRVMARARAQSRRCQSVPGTCIAVHRGFLWWVVLDRWGAIGARTRPYADRTRANAAFPVERERRRGSPDRGVPSGAAQAIVLGNDLRAGPGRQVFFFKQKTAYEI